MHPTLVRITSAAVLLTACNLASTNGPPGPEFHDVAVAANPNNTISAVVRISATGFDSAFVRYWRRGAGALQTPAHAFVGDSTVTVAVLGLDTAADYEFETNLVLGTAPPQPVDTSSFSSGILPAWIPAAVPAGMDTTPGFLALSYPDGPVIIDNRGTVRWYLHSPDPTLNSFQAHPNGRYTLFGATDSPRQFRVLDELGNTVGALQCLEFPTRFHDLLVLAEGDYWITCDETRIKDLTNLGGLDSVITTWTVVQHVSAGGALLFEWKSADHYDITDVPASERMGRSVNATHGNGLALDYDGNLLLSSRTLNEVTKVNVATGAIMWRLGGLRNQFTFVNDSKGTFERQHGLRRAGPGEIQLLDNGLQAPSRFVRYLLNPTTMTALLVMDFRDSPTTLTPVGGSTQYFGSGYGLVSFGRAGRVVETDPAGNRAWELTGIDGTYVFRAERISSLYPQWWRSVPAP
jgi:hypothetical protein